MLDNSRTHFKIGDMVVQRANPNLKGAVVKIIAGIPECRCEVFCDNKRTTFYASQLELMPDETPEIMQLPLMEFQANLTAKMLLHPSLSKLYSLSSARVNFVPYQFRPVMKFIRSDRPRLLIADEVGVGKTIEAGLILRELQARREVRSVIIICPRPLVAEKKWQTEMRRFDEEFSHLDGKTLRHCIAETDRNGEWPDKYSRCIIPFSLFDEALLHGKEGVRKGKTNSLLHLDSPPRFDLVIVDEAHHLRNSQTHLHKGVRYFVDNSEAAIFLTATPIQLGSNDLYVLLNMLRPDVVIDQPSFKFMSEPNTSINEAVKLSRAAKENWQDEACNELTKAGDTEWGKSMLEPNPDFQHLFTLARTHTMANHDRLAFIREAENLNSFSNLINRTRRRDIGAFTIRKAFTREIAFTAEQQSLHDALLAVQEKIFARSHGLQFIKFFMSMIRRQASSCIFGIAPCIKEILSRKWSNVDNEVFEEEAEGWEQSDMSCLQEDIEEVISLAGSISPNDPKLDELQRIIKEKELLPNNKILLFSSFLHSLNYLSKHLKASGIRVGMIQGKVPDDERRELRRRFSLDKNDKEAIDVLLSSEVGCEGLDFQFCDCLVNYDLPWNPMRIEQRIGRIDRYGQLSPTVSIYNLVTPGTVDFEIYDRCLLRIGVFEQSIGGCEEILGDITASLRSVAENIELTPAERVYQLQQLADNQIRNMQEQERLEKEQVELFGVTLPEGQIVAEVKDASSIWLSPSSLQNLIEHYLHKTCGVECQWSGENKLKTLRLNQESREKLLSDFKSLPRVASPVYRDWEKWVKGAEQFLQMTFDQNCASENRKAAFINPTHPLSLQAAKSCESEGSFCTSFVVESSKAKPGVYPFAIYQWRKQGLKDDTELQAVLLNPDLSAEFLSLLEAGEAVDIELPDFSIFEDLEARHYSIWLEAKASHQLHTARRADFQRTSLQKSHHSRIALLRDQQKSAGDDKIFRMRESQIASAEADAKRRLDEIELAVSRADILADRLAFGIMTVEESK